ncbi:MAG TPA: hypothetical protein VFZ09_28225 [Archangium sp.]|uniref:hypothetical protein n=1 Tax=Archangium sp. TaxID=1872627 RepID=UPI002E37F2CD|nr:hypothetical protein [Archangium sp.]HEX5750150.1 hypothetical protein [Archangium sp.]
MNFPKRSSLLTLPLLCGLAACGGAETGSDPGVSDMAHPGVMEPEPLARLPELGESAEADGSVSAMATPVWQIKQNWGGCLRATGTYAYYTTCNSADTAQLWTRSQHPQSVGTQVPVYIYKSAVNINGAGAFQYCLETPEMNNIDGYLRLKPCSHTFNNGYQFWYEYYFTVWNPDINIYEGFRLFRNNYSHDFIFQRSSTDSYAWVASPGSDKFKSHSVTFVGSI